MTNHLDYPEEKTTIHVLTHRYGLSDRESGNTRYTPVQSMTGTLIAVDTERGDLFLRNKDGETIHVHSGRDSDNKLFQEASKVLMDRVVTVGVYNEGK